MAPGISELKFLLAPIAPGPFSAQVHLFVDDDGLREIVLTVQGTAVEARAPPEVEGKP